MSTARKKLSEVYNSLTPEQQRIFKRILALEKEYLYLSRRNSNLTKEVQNIIREEIK